MRRFKSGVFVLVFARNYMSKLQNRIQNRGVFIMDTRAFVGSRTVAGLDL